MEAGAIVGIVLGAVAVLLVVSFLVYWYWWKPYRNKTRHTSSELDVNFDERIRHKLMETYGLPGDMNNPDATMSVNDNDFSLQLQDNPYEFETATELP